MIYFQIFLITILIKFIIIKTIKIIIFLILIIIKIKIFINQNNNIFNINNIKIKNNYNTNNNIFNINNIKIKNTYNTNNNIFNIKSSYPAYLSIVIPEGTYARIGESHFVPFNLCSQMVWFCF